jgi:hypothetical protein
MRKKLAAARTVSTEAPIIAILANLEGFETADDLILSMAAGRTRNWPIAMRKKPAQRME